MQKLVRCGAAWLSDVENYRGAIRTATKKFGYESLASTVTLRKIASDCGDAALVFEAEIAPETFVNPSCNRAPHHALSRVLNTT
jgi:hypothetical protein